MRVLLLSIFLIASVYVNADIVTLTVTVTNIPANNTTLTINSVGRTNKTTVTVPASEVLIGASIGATTTNLYNQALSYLHAGPLIPTLTATNVYTLTGRNGQTLTASASGTWATLTLTTQAVTSLKGVRVPIDGEATASVRTNIASELIRGAFNIGLSTNAVNANSAAMANFVDTSESQTVGGDKTLTGMTTLANVRAANIWDFGATNANITVAPGYGSLGFVDSSSLTAARLTSSTTGYPSLVEAVGGAPISITPASSNVVNKAMGDTVWGQKAAANTWTAANNFGTILGVGTSTAGTSADNVISIANGTAPTSRPADLVQLYASDILSASSLNIMPEADRLYSFGDQFYQSATDVTPIQRMTLRITSADITSGANAGTIRFASRANSVQDVHGGDFSFFADENWSASTVSGGYSFDYAKRGTTGITSWLKLYDGALFIKANDTAASVGADQSRISVADINGGGTASVIFRSESGATNTFGAWGIGKVYTTSASGTSAQLPTTSALLNFGTTDPVVTITKGGTYRVDANVTLRYNAATFAANQTVTLKVRRTSGTAQDYSSRTVTLDIVTTKTATFGVIPLPPLLYSASDGDVLEIWGDVTVLPSAGSIDAHSAEIFVQRLQ